MVEQALDQAVLDIVGTEGVVGGCRIHWLRSAQRMAQRVSLKET